MVKQRAGAAAVLIWVAALAAPASAQQFRPGPCGGIICDLGLQGGKTPEEKQAEAKADPQNCGGLMCDFGMRAFPTQAELAARQAAEAQAAAGAAPPIEPVPVPKKAKRKHVAKAKTPAPPAASVAAESKPN